MKKYIMAAIIASMFAPLLAGGFASGEALNQTVLACKCCRGGKHRK